MVTGDDWEVTRPQVTLQPIRAEQISYPGFVLLWNRPWGDSDARHVTSQ